MQHQIVSRQEWLKARIALLKREKAWTRQRDQIAAERLAMPWVRIEKDYVFAGPQGKLTLSDLFQGELHLNGSTEPSIRRRLRRLEAKVRGANWSLYSSSFPMHPHPN